MHAVTFARRAFFSCDVRPGALVGMFRMADTQPLSREPSH
jgi:hypothetical protein